MILPPNFIQAAPEGKVMLVLEAVWGGDRRPLNALPLNVAFQFSPQDSSLLDAVEALGGGDTPGMKVLPFGNFLRLLPVLAGHPRLSLGRAQSLTITLTPFRLAVEAALENTNVRAPFDGVVIKKRAEVGETVSPFGVAGQASREGGAIATIADLSELEVQTEVSENSVAKLASAMPAEVKLQAYQDQVYKGRLRQIFPSADRAKAIVEVRVSILNPDGHVKPEMTASVTFQESRANGSPTPSLTPSSTPSPIVLVPQRAVTEQGGQSVVWVVTGRSAGRRVGTLGPARLDATEVRSGLVPGEAVILTPPAGLTDHALVRVKGT